MPGCGRWKTRSRPPRRSSGAPRPRPGSHCARRASGSRSLTQAPKADHSRMKRRPRRSAVPRRSSAVAGTKVGFRFADSRFAPAIRECDRARTRRPSVSATPQRATVATRSIFALTSRDHAEFLGPAPTAAESLSLAVVDFDLALGSPVSGDGAALGATGIFRGSFYHDAAPSGAGRTVPLQPRECAVVGVGRIAKIRFKDCQSRSRARAGGGQQRERLESKEDQGRQETAAGYRYFLMPKARSIVASSSGYGTGF